MITLTIKISMYPAKMNGSINIANKIFSNLISQVKKIRLKGLEVDIKTDTIKLPLIPTSIIIPPLVIAWEVCKYFKEPLFKLFWVTRELEIIKIRQISHFLIRDINGLKYPLDDIGLFIGGQDHATVLHNYRTVKDLCNTDKTYKALVEDVRYTIMNKYK